jgi:hypothetical protein
LDQKRSQEIFLSSIDRGLDAFGANVHTVVYFQLRSWFGISREDIPAKPELFVQTIDKLFGVGAGVVALAICTELEKRFGIDRLREKDLLKALRIVSNK